MGIAEQGLEGMAVAMTSADGDDQGQVITARVRLANPKRPISDGEAGGS